jgi:methionine-rich copper-binding protein CopC
MRCWFSVFFLLATLASAEAHSTLVRSEPKAGAVLRAAPNELLIWFTEPLKVGLSTIEVRDAAGKEADQRDLRADAKDATLMHLSLGAKLAPGVYQVTWVAVAQDMHVSKGSFQFGVAPASS